MRDVGAGVVDGFLERVTFGVGEWLVVEGDGDDRLDVGEELNAESVEGFGESGRAGARGVARNASPISDRDAPPAGGGVGVQAVEGHR